MRGRLELRLTDFSGGVRRADATTRAVAGKFGTPGSGGARAPGTKTRPSELQDALNLIYDRRTGLLRRRDGNVFGSTLPAAVMTSLMPASGLPAGAASQMLLSNGASIWVFNGGAIGAAAFTGMTANSLWDSVVAPQSGGQGPLYMSNGADLRYWTGAAGGNWTGTSPAGLPVGYYMQFHNIRVWMANLTAWTGGAPPTLSDPKSALAWSEQGDPRNFPAANVTMFDPNDGDELTGIGRLGSYLVVFKRRKTWLVYDLDTSANRQLSAGIGCISHRSIVETPHGLLFMSERGPAICDGSSIKMIEDKLNLVAYIDLSASRSNLNRYINAASTGDDYYVNVSPQANAQLPLAHYDILNDAWWLHGCPTERMVMWNGQGYNLNELWAIDADGLITTTSRALVRMFAAHGSDNIADDDAGGQRPISAWGRLRDLDLGTDVRKRLRSVTVEANGVVYATFFADGSPFGSGLTIGSIDLTSATGLQRYTWPRPAAMPPAQRLGFQVDTGSGIASAVNPPPFEIAAITLHADRRER